MSTKETHNISSLWHSCVQNLKSCILSLVYCLLSLDHLLGPWTQNSHPPTWFKSWGIANSNTPNFFTASNFLLALTHSRQIQLQVWWAIWANSSSALNHLWHHYCCLLSWFSQDNSPSHSFNTDTVAQELHPSVALISPTPRKLCSLSGQAHTGRLCCTTLW